MSKIVLKNIQENNNFNDELMQKLNKIKNEYTNRGINIINGVYIPYDYKININNEIYYINIGLANGKNKFGIMDICKYYNNMDFKNIDEFIDIVKMKKFNYKIIKYKDIKYKDITYMYIFNKQYENCFNKYNDIDM